MVKIDDNYPVFMSNSVHTPILNDTLQFMWYVTLQSEMLLQKNVYYVKYFCKIIINTYTKTRSYNDLAMYTLNVFASY